MTAELSAHEFRRVLIANRGEIAWRVARACDDAGLSCVAVFADGDAAAPFVAAADEAVALGGASAAETYLDAAKLLAAARRSGADAVHPGYGFLAESAEFATAVIDAGLVWIGPPPTVIRTLGDKVAARRLATSVGVQTVAGTDEPLADAAAVAVFVAEHGLPVVVKAAHGGGGRGMRVVRQVGDIPALWSMAVSEATVAFGRPECFVERYVERARHVEVQLLADIHGDVVVVGDRDCTVQRRHQKLVEEAPAPFLPAAVRAVLHDSAARIGRAAGYVGAGTVEFLLDAEGGLWFLEVNCRLQVEHPVTEEVAGVDLVRAQLAIAAGGHVPLVDAGADPRRHAIELRLTAEDPGRGFAPSCGPLTELRLPAGPGVRVDAGVVAGSVVSEQFDSLLAKVIVTGADRDEALARARRALGETAVEGVVTSLAFLRALLDHDAFSAAGGETFSVYTGWVEEALDGELGETIRSSPTAEAALIHVPIGGRWMQVKVPGLAAASPEVRTAARQRRAASRQPADASDVVLVPMQSTVVALHVAEGDAVDGGDPVAVVEAMKMQHLLVAPHAGRVTGLDVAVGASVANGAVLCRIVA